MRMIEIVLFLKFAIIGAVLVGIGTGMMSPLVTTNRLGFLTGSIAHAVLGGIGIAVFFQVNPIIGALVAAPILATLVGVIDLKLSRNSDTMIGAIWAMGMAAGVIAIYLSPGYGIDYSTLLFGNILLISQTQVLILTGLDLLIALVIWLFFTQLCAISFDRDFSSVRGINTTAFHLLLVNLVAITAVLSIHAVGLILVIALMLLPSAIARNFTQSFRSLIGYSIIISIFVALGGIWLSYALDIPTGPTIILLLGALYIFSILIQALSERHIGDPK